MKGEVCGSLRGKKTAEENSFPTAANRKERKKRKKKAGKGIVRAGGWRRDE